VFCESKGEYTSTYSANVSFGCSGLALCGVKVKHLLSVGQVIITNREPSLTVTQVVNPKVLFSNGNNTRNHNHNHNHNRNRHYPHHHL
jgi:hypothetical protein